MVAITTYIKVDVLITVDKEIPVAMSYWYNFLSTHIIYGEKDVFDNVNHV